MPGMTMAFRVRDAKLLEQIRPDQETGVIFERIDGALVITGFQK